MYVISAIKIVWLYHGSLELSATAAYVFRYCKDSVVTVVYIQQPPCVLTGSARPSKFVIRTCVSRTIFIKIRPQTIRIIMYDQLGLRLYLYECLNIWLHKKLILFLFCQKPRKFYMKRCNIFTHIHVFLYQVMNQTLSFFFRFGMMNFTHSETNSFIIRYFSNIYFK